MELIELAKGLLFMFVLLGFEIFSVTIVVVIIYQIIERLPWEKS